MASKTTLKLLFTGILVAMIVCTAFASTQQSMFQWGGKMSPPRTFLLRGTADP